VADLARVASRVWYGDDAAAAATRALLAPAALLYGAAMRARGALYRTGVLGAHDLALPAVSVGNVTVGGTGKTPMSSWLAQRLHDRGARPAIVLRGYGDDEPLVHRLLTPDARVVVDADRVRGVAEAARLSADVAVLDDAFQHRRARRDEDVVLVSAERVLGRARVLPAGPYREPLSALRRASLIVVTRKSASREEGAAALRRVREVAPNVPAAIVALGLDALRRVSGAESASLHELAGARVLAVSAIGEPAAFFAQLAALGARLTTVTFPDHHAFSRGDVEALVRRASGVDRVVCTLKDAVKLGPLWPDPALAPWYVSQRVTVEAGGDALDQLIARLLDARAHSTEQTGIGRPS